ncbi:unnamed protein product, partial [Prorocentrum cordatum]
FSERPRITVRRPLRDAPPRRGRRAWACPSSGGGERSRRWRGRGGGGDDRWRGRGPRGRGRGDKARPGRASRARDRGGARVGNRPGSGGERHLRRTLYALPVQYDCFFCDCHH